MRTRLLVAAGLLGVLAAGCGTAGASPGAAGGDTLASGIGVQGEWSITVHEGDGSLVSTTEFHNDLTITGETTLARVLTGEFSIGDWLVVLDGEPADPCDDGTSDAPCYLHEVDTQSYGQPNDFDTLATSYDATSSAVVLEGSAVVATDASISRVTTKVGTCVATTAPATCNAVQRLGPSFTSTALASPVAVAAGQTVSVTVELSFGTLPAQP